jgi:hypothetical protein
VIIFHLVNLFCFDEDTSGQLRNAKKRP